MRTTSVSFDIRRDILNKAFDAYLWTEVFPLLLAHFTRR